MDDFRCVTLPDPYIYVIDPKTGENKAVIDKFFSFLWVERRAEAGELEITAPEDVYWSTLVSPGDYIQFRASSVSDYFHEERRPDNVGRYTMVVEAKYTTWDADTGYTTYVKGHSLDILLNRRINLGIVDEFKTPAAKFGAGWCTDDASDNDWRHRQRDGYLFGLISQGNEYVGDRKAREDTGKEYFGMTMVTNNNEKNYQFNSVDIPYIIENLASDSSKATHKTWETRSAELITNVIRYNCGDMAFNGNRQFPNFEVRHDASYFNELNTDVIHGDPIDGRFENVYDIVTEQLPKLTTYTVVTSDTGDKKLHSSKTYLSMRLVGWTEWDEKANSTKFKMGFELYRGVDRTINGPNAANAPVVYSRDMDNLVSMNYLTGEANYKNVIYYDTQRDYTPDDIWDKNKEVEKLEHEKDGIADDEAKSKELESKIEKLQEEIDKLQDDYDKRGFRMPYISVIDRTQMDKFNIGEVDIASYPKGLDRREMYVDDSLPFIGSRPTDPDDDTEVEWQGRAYELYRYTVQKDAEQEGGKATYVEKYLGIEWDYGTQQSIYANSKNTFADSENSKDDSVEAELNYNAIYQPKRNYDIGDLVTIMGLHHNELTRVAQIDEMAYSIDSSGYTIVPTFTILPIEDDAV